jgi:hypothetical protein
MFYQNFHWNVRKFASFKDPIALRFPTFSVYDAVWKNVGMKVYEDFFRKDEK